ncbi:C2H2 type zinc-finger-domain-containing protein [Scleroderma citrinum]
MSSGSAETPLFTCLSCTIAFTSAEDQRVHYRSDHHRYNMKRRVSGLPPVSVVVFNQKVLERRAETAVVSSPKDLTCDLCGKTYTTENAYRSHINSRKHKENELKTPARIRKAPITSSSSFDLPQLNEDEGDLESALAAKIATARENLDAKACLFCESVSTSISTNLEHMSSTHSFFIPDAEYLVDLPGLLTSLGEKIHIGNMCIYCNGRGRELRTLEAVRKHMVDKSHCKIAYDTEEDRLGVSDFYDFTNSYPDGNGGGRSKTRDKRPQRSADEDEWEDMEDDGDEEVDDVTDEHNEASDSDDLPSGQITYGDTEYELVLPSGARIGHRSMKRYYDQSFYGIHVKEQDPNSGAALVRQLLKDKNSALVPRMGAFGAFGGGTEVVKARNKGEAKEAGRHVREFRDQRRREEFKTKIGFIHNNQKHYRDPLLQVKIISLLFTLFVLAFCSNGPLGHQTASGSRDLYYHRQEKYEMRRIS